MLTKKTQPKRKLPNRSYYADIFRLGCDSEMEIKPCKCCFEGEVVATSIKEGREILEKFKKWKKFPKESQIKVCTTDYPGRPGHISEKKKGVYKFRYVKDKEPDLITCGTLKELIQGFGKNGRLLKGYFVGNGPEQSTKKNDPDYFYWLYYSGTDAQWSNIRLFPKLKK